MTTKTRKQTKKLAVELKNDKKGTPNLKKSAKNKREMRQEFSNYLSSGH